MTGLELLFRPDMPLVVWSLVWVAAAAVMWGRGRVVPTVWFVTWPLGALVVRELVPPSRGLVPGLPRTWDLPVEHVLWPWQWFQPDPRLGGIVLMLLAGLPLSRRPSMLFMAAGTPLVVEVLQYAVPSLARVGSTPDLVHAWMALACGSLIGIAATSLWARRPSVSRRAVVVAALAAVVAVGVAIAVPSSSIDPRASTPVAGKGFHVPAGDTPASEAAAWLADGTIPGSGGPYEEMSRVALWDLQLLTTNGLKVGALPAAGPSEKWGYFWPRDGAFLVVALHRTGHELEATGVLEGVSTLYLDPMYGFDARYLLSGERVYLDPRRAQVDGCGWVLWAIHETSQGVRSTSKIDRLRDRCTDQLLRSTGGGSHLPSPGQDYWEQTSHRYLLGASAPVAAGLRFAARDYRKLGQSQRAETVQRAAEGVRAEINEIFGPGFQRSPTQGGVDASSAMLMPPFDPQPLPGVADAWARYQRDAIRPAGGLAPGAEWKNDGTSWTPEVALVAYSAAASGDRSTALHWLAWLDRHRTEWGSLPEKVDWKGDPGGPAPLGWTSALVILTLDELDADDVRR